MCDGVGVYTEWLAVGVWVCIIEWVTTGGRTLQVVHVGKVISDR